MPKVGDTAKLYCEKCNKNTPHVCTSSQEKIGQEGILSEWKCKKCNTVRMYQLG